MRKISAKSNKSWVKERKPSKLLQKIFELRKSKKITLAELGKALGGVKDSTASDIENGDVPLKADYLSAVAKLLGVQTWELFVDYKASETGPCSEDERELMLNFRAVKDDETRKAIKNILKKLAKK